MITIADTFGGQLFRQEVHYTLAMEAIGTKQIVKRRGLTGDELSMFKSGVTLKKNILLGLQNIR